ncbi:MAG: hypothetical protein SYC29_00820 [Planctomycetota bacterium]|nr:hypothetical protein [Planctomycetota bacterium]
MRSFRLRSNLKRAAIGDFALPLGLVPGDVDPPQQGYTVDYAAGEDDEPDTYLFHVVVSHERLAPLLERAFALLPRDVYGIVEIGSRDAYRSADVYMGQEPIPRDEFRAGWKQYQPFLLEDGSIGAGANSEEPFLEIFLDQWKGLSLHVPLSMRGDIEDMLDEFGLNEVSATWPAMDDEASEKALRLRPVLELEDAYSPDVDELLLQLRHVWNLELNVDPDTNVDEAGRALGRTLWHAMVIIESADEPDAGAYVSIWATAGSLTEVERLIDSALASSPNWRFVEVYTIDRVAYDERPDELTDLPPKREKSEVHLVSFERWPGSPDPDAPAETEKGDRGG